MGKVLTDEDIKLNIIINGNEAQKELFDLEKSTRKLTEENKALGLQKKLLIKQGKEETDAYRLLTKTIADNNKEIRTNKTRMNELQKEIGITGLTMKQLTDRANILKMSLRNTIPGSEANRRYRQELDEVNNRLGELSTRSRTARSSIGALADGFNRYAALGASVIAVITGVVVSLQQMIDYNGKLSDAQANVMKTTRMTKKEVDELTKSFGLFQTRTSRIDLLKIAEEGGRIGIVKEEIGDFVEVMNKATVALGDSFTGGVGEVAEKLGKLKFLFKETKEMGVDQAYNSIGSAINELGADGVASERNIAEFTTRLGSLSDALKPSIANALGLGAAFEESGIEAEIASRAYNIFLKQASTETAKFGKVMKISQSEVERLINADPMEFFLKFAEGMKGLDAVDTAKILDFLGINADGANKAIGAVSNNIARFRSQIELSNQSFNTGTSLIEEYDIKNNNLAATLEKVKKKLIGAFSSETVITFLASMAEWIGKVVGATDDLDGSAQKWRNTLAFTAKAIAVVTAALLTNVAWQKLVVLWTTRNTQANLLYTLGVRARALAEGTAMVASQVYAATTMLLTGNIKGATKAIRVMTATMATTPWGLLLSLIAAVGVAYIAFSKSADQAATVQKTLSDVHLEATKSIAAQKKEVELLEKIVKNENLAEEIRIKALEKLNELIPDHIGILTLENIAMSEGIDILKKYTDEIYKNARAKAAQSKFEELARQKLDVESKSGSQYKSGVGKFMTKITGQGDGMDFKTRKEVEQYVLKTFADYIGKRTDKTTGATVVNTEKFNLLVDKYIQDYGIADKEEELARIDSQMKALEGDLTKAAIDDLNKRGETTTSTYVIPDKASGGKKEKQYNDSYLNDELRLIDELYQARRKAEEDRIALMKEGYEKQMALEKLNHENKLHEFSQQNKSIAVLEKQLTNDLLHAQKTGDDKKVVSIKNMQRLLVDKKSALNDQMQYAERLHQLRIGTIQENAANDHLKKEEENYQRAKIRRETKHFEELADLGTNERAKEKLRKQFAEEELKNEEEYLLVLIDRLNKIAGKDNFTGFDLSLLTPEQVAEFTAEAEKVGLTLAQLIAKKNELAGKGASETAANMQALGLGGEKDILGFSPDNWNFFLENLQSGKLGIEGMLFAVQALTNMWSQYSAYLTANENAQLQKFERSSDAKKTKLKRQFDAGYISQNQYNKQVEALDRELDIKKAELEYKQAKRQRAINLANAVSGTAVAVINALQTQPVWAGLVMAGLVGVMGALQIATIMKTPLPTRGYEKGLYPEYVNVTREQDGKSFRPKYAGKLKSGLVTQNSLMVAEGNKPEMVIDNKAWSRMPPHVQDMIIREIRGVKGFEKGYYKEGTLFSGPSDNSSPKDRRGDDVPNNDRVLLEMVLKVVTENTEAINDLKRYPLTANVNPYNLRNMRHLQDGLDNYDEIKTKQKK